MKNRHIAWKTTPLLAGAILLLSGCACAESTDPQGRPPRPPKEALEACKDAVPGDTCSFSSPVGAASGVCWAPAGKPLACKPVGAPPSAPDTEKP